MNPNRTYRPPLPQIPADPLCGNPCDSHDPRRCVPPLKGLPETRAASVSYRASVPAGHAYCEVAPSYRALFPAADRQNRSFKALSGKGSAPATPPPFRHTPFRPRPRHTAPVWRNPGQHPHRDGTFTFSAKERDPETGLSYFGSRYYSSDLSVWLSVDPMAAKYPHQSNYVYCSNNPLNLIDPNGEDEWENDKKGNVNWICKSDEHRLYALDKNGKRTGNFITVKDKSSLEQLRQSRNDYDGHYSVCNKEDAFKIFKFGADHCDVEWAVAGYNTKGGGREYVVGTSNEIPDNGYSGTVYDFHNSNRFDKFNLSFYIHSHPGPDATQGASDGYYGTDMGNIIRLYYSYRDSGRSTIPGKGFPRHYVYTPNTRTLYYYSVYKSSVFIRGNIRSANDLYRNLAF